MWVIPQGSIPRWRRLDKGEQANPIYYSIQAIGWVNWGSIVLLLEDILDWKSTWISSILWYCIRCTGTLHFHVLIFNVLQNMFAVKLFDMLCYALPFHPLSPCQQTHSHTHTHTHTHRASGTVHTAMEVATGQEVRTVATYVYMCGYLLSQVKTLAMVSM